ncbi:Phenylpropionate dioxygenase, large terminal subunit [Fulvimarina manganoxydans]|uniref:Phenylpropionate dioxygenase, large terminal subunit n=1 Tax=Fulvimarina manganoxydans TaxID=937218 RepID=A0A1W1YAQ7_9HYPH|nr:SRPBCC family protein [Fulvimarina manganoxydans]SMC33229.1 Phenylpropionate dioxygenase, large terminal subunit [Fulvimarina manganoxydans]
MNIHAPVRTAADELAANVSVPFESARAMPRSVYMSDEFLQLELEHIFSKDWICAGRVDALKEPGDYLTLEIAGEPIIVLRDKDGALRAMSNVCRHRMSVLLEGRGNTRAIVCPYHAWTYNLDGSLRGAPAMTRNDSFCKSDVRLPEVRCEEWLGFIMVTLDPDTPPPSETLAEAAAMIEHLDLASYSETFREHHLWDTNWKVLAENFMESYHLPICHRATIGGSTDINEMVLPEGKDAFNWHTILRNDAVPLALAHPNDTRLQGDERRTTWLFAIYPSLMISITPGYFWYLSLHPEGPGQVRILWGGGMSPHYMADPSAPAQLETVKAMLEKVNDEDRGCTERVYRGLLGRLAEAGPLSHLERPNFDFAQYISRRVNGR